MDEIKLGDVVRLKSGGPKMTVDNRMMSGFKCVWFEENKQFSETYQAHSLEKVS